MDKKSVVIKYRSKLPVKILTECVNYPVTIATLNNKHNKGTLKNIETKTLNAKLDDKAIKGNNIKYIVLPDIMRFNPLFNEVLEYNNNKLKSKHKKTKKSLKKPDNAKKSNQEREIKNLVSEINKRENRKRQLETESKGSKKQKV